MVLHKLKTALVTYCGLPIDVIRTRVANTELEVSCGLCKVSQVKELRDGSAKR